MIFGLEVSLLAFGYHYRANVTAAFHDGLSRGLQEYGKDTDRTAAVDDIQTTVRRAYMGIRGGSWGSA